jgi:hypothetical protein
MIAVAVAAAQQPPPPPPPPTVPPFPGDGGFGNFRPAAQQFKELVPALITTLGDADTEVRQHAGMALAALGQDAVTALVDALKDPQKERRAGAAYALGQMGFVGREAIPPLLGALKDSETAVKRSAAHALANILSNEQGFGNAMPGFGGPPGRPMIAPGIAVPGGAPGLPPPGRPERVDTPPPRRDSGR